MVSQEIMNLECLGSLTSEIPTLGAQPTQFPKPSLPCLGLPLLPRNVTLGSNYQPPATSWPTITRNPVFDEDAINAL